MSINSIFGALFIFHSVSLCVYIAFVFFLFFFPGHKFVTFFNKEKETVCIRRHAEGTGAFSVVHFHSSGGIF